MKDSVFMTVVRQLLSNRLARKSLVNALFSDLMNKTNPPIPGYAYTGHAVSSRQVVLPEKGQF